MTETAHSGEPTPPPREPRERPALSHRELGIASLVWTLFGLLHAVAGHGAAPVALHALAAALTLGCAALAWRGRERLAFHLAAAVSIAALSAYCIAAGTVDDGVLVLVLVPVLATYVDSARSGLVWLGVVAIALAVIRVVEEFGVIPAIFEPLVSLREPVILALAAIMWLFAQRSRARSDFVVERLAEREREANARVADLARLKLELEAKNAALDTLNDQFARSAREVSEMNLELADARDAALAQAKEAVDFLTRMSHEIRTPLNGILGITDVLAGSKLDREAREHVAILESSGKLLRRLVDEVLDLARLDAGKLQLVEDPFDPLTIAEDVTDLFAAQAYAKQVALVAIAPPMPPPRLLGDSMRVRQVLQNLVGNAVKFTARGHVRVEVTIEGGELAYRVEDTGPGMTAEALAGLFKEYGQDREGARRGGSGLGLVIAQRLARAMGGDIEARSELGRGSTFTARFKLGRSSTQTADVGELSGAVVYVGLVGADDLLALAVERTGALVNILVTRYDSIDAASQARSRPSLLLVSGDDEVPSELGPIVRLRPPASDTLPTQGGPVLLLPPRRSRLVRAVRVVRGRGREPTRDEAPARPTGLTALVVDDEPVNRKIASLLLGREGWAVRPVTSGAEAVELARGGERLDAIFVDLDMPGIDGIETAQAASTLFRTGRRPWVVLQTASLDEAVRGRAREAGIADFLPKPVDSALLRAVLGRAARHRRIEDRRAARALTRPPRDPATHPVTALVGPIAHAVACAETEVALAQLGELQILARRRQLDRIDRCCSALHDALLEGEGVEALVDLEEAVWMYANDASTEGASLS